MRCSLLPIALLTLVLVPPRVQEPSEEPTTVLEGHMKEIEASIKTLRKCLRDPVQRDGALAALVEIQGHAFQCKQLEPEAAQAQPETERAALLTAYRRTMVDFLMRQLELEAALLDGDAKAIQESFDRLRAMEDEAHQRFAPEDD